MRENSTIQELKEKASKLKEKLQLHVFVWKYSKIWENYEFFWRYVPKTTNIAVFYQKLKIMDFSKSTDLRKAH